MALSTLVDELGAVRKWLLSISALTDIVGNQGVFTNPHPESIAYPGVSIKRVGSPSLHPIILDETEPVIELTAWSLTPEQADLIYRTYAYECQRILNADVTVGSVNMRISYAEEVIGPLDSVDLDSQLNTVRSTWRFRIIPLGG